MLINAFHCLPSIVLYTYCTCTCTCIYTHVHVTHTVHVHGEVHVHVHIEVHIHVHVHTQFMCFGYLVRTHIHCMIKGGKDEEYIYYTLFLIEVIISSCNLFHLLLFLYSTRVYVHVHVLIQYNGLCTCICPYTVQWFMYMYMSLYSTRLRVHVYVLINSLMYVSTCVCIYVQYTCTCMYVYTVLHVCMLDSILLAAHILEVY